MIFPSLSPVDTPMPETRLRWRETLLTVAFWAMGLVAAAEVLKTHTAPPPPPAHGLLSPPLNGLGSSLQGHARCPHCGQPPAARIARQQGQGRTNHD